MFKTLVDDHNGLYYPLKKGVQSSPVLHQAGLDGMIEGFRTLLIFLHKHIPISICYRLVIFAVTMV